jgi:hypothetical protein
MNLKLCFVSIFIFIFHLIYSQKYFKPGYIVENNGDTIKGLINYKRDQVNCQFCYFRRTQSDSILTLSPYQIAAYRFTNDKLYISKAIQYKDKEIRRVFLNCLFLGKVNIYLFADNGKSRYFIEKDSLGRVEIPFREYLKDDEKGIEHNYRSTIQKGIL